VSGRRMLLLSMLVSALSAGGCVYLAQQLVPGIGVVGNLLAFAFGVGSGFTLTTMLRVVLVLRSRRVVVEQEEDEDALV
jgi:hypothetical protein